MVPSAAAHDPDVHLRKANAKVDSRSELYGSKHQKQMYFERGHSLPSYAQLQQCLATWCRAQSQQRRRVVHSFASVTTKHLRGKVCEGVTVSSAMKRNSRFSIHRTQLPYRGCHNSHGLWHTRLTNQDPRAVGESCIYSVYLYPQSTLCTVAKQLVDKTESL